MNTLEFTPLDAQLGSILKRVQALERLNLAMETERQQALEESRCLLGAIASYRHGLSEAPPDRLAQRRWAA